ncbi:BRCT domain-containing protein At4g02110 isoform X3 [Sesamum indicum]|uniref:RING-type E3 ubiquitin transferase BRCA1 n=1 Tax=Sesamum indicum TaxID=4182 RepID=A0A8M8V6G7_SESIN|nr:BRCT domain-containing protein At4g02110 isoform X3 [Sesamum indicum]
MEDKSAIPLKGMESILATVSGYHGAERFNLIRLISRTGASYVGSMNQSVTHLVCWKFEGRKYELAKKLKIKIVNHRWIEECVKKGKRVSEEPYTSQSGEETGPLCLDVRLGINPTSARSRALKNTKEPVIDIECEGIYDRAWTELLLFDEDPFPQQRQNGRRSNRSARKAIERSLRKDCPSSSRYCLETPSGPTVMELEEASTSLPAYSCRQRKRNSISPESQGKGRRLVKKRISMDDWLLTSNVEEYKEDNVLPENNFSRILSDSSDVERDQGLPNGRISDARCFLSGQDDGDGCDGLEENEDVNAGNLNPHIHVAQSSLLETSDELKVAANEDFIDVDPGSRLPASSEFSCVICWTDFSSTRGVLPCGHRFCFSCIQNWADHMPSAIVCCRCFSREPEDLLIRCNFCQTRCVHSYCLDPLLLPWICVHCKDLQMLYLHSR